MSDSPAVVTIDTWHAGLQEVPADSIATFIAPLLGFERFRRWLIHQTQPGPLWWMQATDKKDTVFCILKVFESGLDPDIDLTPADLADLGTEDLSTIDVYSIVTLDKDPQQVRTNLRAPILVCRTTGKAKQLVLDDARLPVRFYLKDLKPQKQG